MPPNILADFYLKQGIGQARFGQYRRAEALMEEALRVATAAGLHESEFRIERIKNGLRECEQALRVEPAVPAEPRSEEHTSELQSRLHLVCRLLLEKKKKI